MGDRLRKALKGWIGWVLIALLGAGYFVVHLIAEDADRAEARGEKIGREMRQRIGADLRAKSAVRHQKMMDAIKSGALFKAPASAPASNAPTPVSPAPLQAPN